MFLLGQQLSNGSDVVVYAGMTWSPDTGECIDWVDTPNGRVERDPAFIEIRDENGDIDVGPYATDYLWGVTRPPLYFNGQYFYGDWESIAKQLENYLFALPMEYTFPHTLKMAGYQLVVNEKDDLGDAHDAIILAIVEYCGGLYTRSLVDSAG